MTATTQDYRTARVSEGSSALKRLGAALLLLAWLAGTANAFDQTTRWYSINIRPATDSTPPLFLSEGSEGVTLERYRSGDPTQMWALVDPDYPTAPAVSGHGIPLLDCVLNVGCPFSGHGGAVVRVVSRSSGRCLAFGSSRAIAAPCSTGQSDTEGQKWKMLYAPNEIGMSFTPFIALNGGQAQCLGAVSNQGKNAAGTGLEASACRAGDYAWFQLFQVLVSQEISCTTRWSYNLCVVEGQ